MRKKNQAGCKCECGCSTAQWPCAVKLSIGDPWNLTVRLTPSYSDFLPSGAFFAEPLIPTVPGYLANSSPCATDSGTSVVILVWCNGTKLWVSVGEPIVVCGPYGEMTPRRGTALMGVVNGNYVNNSTDIAYVPVPFAASGKFSTASFNGDPVGIPALFSGVSWTLAPYPCDSTLWPDTLYLSFTGPTSPTIAGSATLTQSGSTWSGAGTGTGTAFGQMIAQTIACVAVGTATYNFLVTCDSDTGQVNVSYQYGTVLCDGATVPCDDYTVGTVTVGTAPGSFFGQCTSPMAAEGSFLGAGPLGGEPWIVTA